MKKKITVMIVTMMVMFTTVFAKPGPDKINQRVQAAFSEKYSDVSDVRWSTHKKYIKAAFVRNEQPMFALFTYEGELIGTARNIISVELPVKLQLQLKKELAGGWITEVIEFFNDEGTTFFATVENSDEQTFFKTEGFNSWKIVKKIKKS